MKQDFKQIPLAGLEYYYVNSDGVIRNDNPHPRATKWPKVQVSERGYLYVMTSNSVTKRQFKLYVHIAVALCHVHNPEPDLYKLVLHGDDNTGNPVASNLRWGTQKQNMEQSSQTGHYSTVKKEVDLISPTGELVHVVGLRTFCAEQGLDWGNFNKMVSRRLIHRGSKSYYTNSVQGWTLA